MANRPTIPPKTVTRLWLAAGGRCEYPGCNKPLWRDDLTMKRLNQSYIAHILGVNPESARWDEVRSQQLVKEFSNLMLLCDVCHNRVDKAERDAHDEALLARYKREHETRIELLTGLTPERRTQLVMFGANIADGKGLVNYRRAADAVLPDRYPVDGSGITLDLTRGGLTDDHPLYWDTVKEEVERHVGTRLAIDVIGDVHVSLFAIAPIPALVLLGRRVRNLRAGEVFQLQRDGSWKWSTEPTGEVDLGPAPVPAAGGTVAWSLSVSGLVKDEEIHRVLGDDVAVYRLDVGPTRSREWMRSRDQLIAFRRRCQDTLQVIRAAHGQDQLVHVFPATPNSASVELGRLLLPNADPTLLVYNNHSDGRGWVPAIQV